MKPHELLAETRTPAGDLMTLTRHGSEYIILAGGKPLMSSRMHGSEEALAAIGCRWARTLKEPCVLVGGLGMGFTLRATLDLLPPDATVVVAELLLAVVEWNRSLLGPLADHPLKDRRVRVDVGDVAATLRGSPGRFDAVLLDVDNGPDFLIHGENRALYTATCLRVAYAQLTDAGAEKLKLASCGHVGSIRTLLEDHLSEGEIEELSEILGKLPGVAGGDDTCAAP